MDDLINSANQKFKDRLSKINVEMKKRNIEYAEPAEMIEIWKSIKNQND